MDVCVCVRVRVESGERRAEHARSEQRHCPGHYAACVLSRQLLDMAMLVRARKLCCRCVVFAVLAAAAAAVIQTVLPSR